MGLSCYKCRCKDVDITFTNKEIENNNSSLARFPTQESINKVNQEIKKDDNSENLKKSDCSNTSISLKIIYEDEGILDSRIRSEEE